LRYTYSEILVENRRF